MGMHWRGLSNAVDKNGYVLTVTMKRLRDVHGTAKLGTHVRKEISRTLAEWGLGHVPQELPKYQNEQVRLYKNGTSVADLISLVLKPGRPNDKKLVAKVARLSKADSIKPGKNRKPKLPMRRLIAMYQSGKTVSEIAKAMGYPAGKGQNRVAEALIAAGVYKGTRTVN